MKEVLPLANVYSRTQSSGHSVGSTVHFLSYRNKGALSDVWDDVMVDGKKRINPRWVSRLSPAAIAYWFMDDGTSCYRDRSVVVRFSTYSFQLEEIYMLTSSLLSMGVRTGIHSSQKGPVLSVREGDSKRFMELVASTVLKVPCMTYKLKLGLSS